VVGRLVLHCEQNKCAISDISLEKLSEFCELFADDVYEEISESTCVSKRNIIGGPAPEMTKEHIKKIKEYLK